ncbi:uncharacterized protein LOC117493208 isoform X2 [Trematomus bernacchii]|uniref:uncharacterized protein LOC117493208 isoform X2 n=1 Tax=Trematomus bernacchii TaxID=40690 RepID=UPI00146A84FA|nr:uncharacterized protein LOC117493208 isoform X2 [Trematomus bernacchii]
MSTSTSTACDLPMASHPSDAEVDLEGWVRLWENAGGIPSADISWLKEDTERGLFTPVQTYKDIRGQIKRRRVMKSDRMWFYPPEPPGFVGGGLPTPQLFFRSRVFVWRPVGVWRYSIKCPRGENCVGSGRNVHLSKYVSSAMCPVGTQSSQKSCPADPVPRQPGAKRVFQWAGGLRGITPSCPSSARLTKPSFLPCLPPCVA